MVAGTFSDVPMQNKPPTVWPGHPMSDKQLGQQLYVQRIKNGELLHIEFPLEDQTPYYETAPAEFLANLIGHESSGSLLSYLKSKSWASSLVAGTACSATGWSSFAIDIDMTETGKSAFCRCYGQRRLTFVCVKSARTTLSSPSSRTSAC
jgi:insulysin